MFAVQGQMNFSAPIRTSAPLGPPAPIQLPKAETNGGETTQSRKEEKDKPVEVETSKEVLEEVEKVEVLHSDIAPPPPAFDNHTPMKESTARKEETIEEKHTEEKEEEDEGVHHATVATVTGGEGESTSLESYGTCAVALYDYQVIPPWEM